MAERLEGTIERINGSLIIGKFKEEPKMGDLIEVGNLKLMGEIVRLSQETAHRRPKAGGAGNRHRNPARRRARPRPNGADHRRRS